jgi:hypothetical protein
VLGNIAVEHHNNCYDEECQIATEESNKAYTIMQQRSYARASVEADRALKKWGKKYVDGRGGNMRIIKLKKIEHLINQNQAKKFCKEINRPQKDYKF